MNKSHKKQQDSTSNPNPHAKFITKNQKYEQITEIELKKFKAMFISSPEIFLS